MVNALKNVDQIDFLFLFQGNFCQRFQYAVHRRNLHRTLIFRFFDRSQQSSQQLMRHCLSYSVIFSWDLRRYFNVIDVEKRSSRIALNCRRLISSIVTIALMIKIRRIEWQLLLLFFSFSSRSSYSISFFSVNVIWFSLEKQSSSRFP